MKRYTTWVVTSKKDFAQPSAISERMTEWMYDTEDELFRQIEACRTRWEWATLMDRGLRDRFAQWKLGNLD